MKRDLDLYRTILTAMEDTPSDKSFHPSTLKEYSDSEVREHLKLMEDAGLVEITESGIEIGGRMFSKSQSYRMTHTGHDFLANSKNEGVWKEAKGKAGSMAFDVFSEVLKAVAKASLGLP